MMSLANDAVQWNAHNICSTDSPAQHADAFALFHVHTKETVANVVFSLQLCTLRQPPQTSFQEVMRKLEFSAEERNALLSDFGVIPSLFRKKKQQRAV